MTRHADLIAKLEAAPEGSRDLDEDIALALGWCLVPPGPFSEEKWLPPDWNDPKTDPDFPDPPWFSRSLDAARSLFPEGSRWEVRGCFNITQTKRVGICRIVIGEVGHCRELEAEAA